MTSSSFLQKLSKHAVQQVLQFRHDLSNLHPVGALFGHHVASGAPVERGFCHPGGFALEPVSTSRADKLHLRSVGTSVIPPMVARGPAHVATPGQLAPVHIHSLRAAGGNPDQHRPGRAPAPGGWRRSEFSPWDYSRKPPFERGKVAQAAIDVLAVLAGLALIGATAFSIVESFFLLFFARF